MNTSILDRIKEILDFKGLTIAELERKADLGNGTIRRWENSIPSADKLQRAAKVLGTTMEYLLNGSDDETDAASVVLARGISSLTDEQMNVVKSLIDQFNKDNNIK